MALIGWKEASVNIAGFQYQRILPQINDACIAEGGSDSIHSGAHGIMTHHGRFQGKVVLRKLPGAGSDLLDARKIKVRARIIGVKRKCLIIGAIGIQRIGTGIVAAHIIINQYRCQLPGAPGQQRLNGALRILFAGIAQQVNQY